MSVNKTWAVDVLLEGEVATYYLRSIAGAKLWNFNPPRQLELHENQDYFTIVPKIPDIYEVVNGPYIVTIEYTPEHFKIAKEEK